MNSMMVFGFAYKHRCVLCFLSLKNLLALTYGIGQFKLFLSDDDVKSFDLKQTKQPQTKKSFSMITASNCLRFSVGILL